MVRESSPLVIATITPVPPDKDLGYATFFPAAKDYDLLGAPKSWARVPAVRHAMSNSSSTYFWYLDQNSLIMNPDINVETDIMNPKKLESMMIKDQPIVPPDSVIKTWPHLKGNQAQLVLTQDKEGLADGSFIIRRGEWGQFFLDTWYDPLYRSYNFQKADTHALVSTFSVYTEPQVSADWNKGTYRSMAPDDSCEACPYTPTSYRCRQQGICFPGDRRI